jgi:antitoxin (DNA-binding transcriptional repressor) of toxin-antitoxin stability system
MKTITAEQAAEEFKKYSDVAHRGEKIMVTLDGKPWVLLSPPPAVIINPAIRTDVDWPNFDARLAPHYPVNVPGPTAAEILAKDREDRF